VITSAITSQKYRVVGLDLVKGTMLAKLTLTHLALCFVSSHLGFAAFGGMWTFTVLIFCFGIGIGLSSRGGNLMMLGLLAATYVITALVSSVPDPSGMSPLYKLLTFRAGEFNGHYLFPDMIYSTVRLVMNGKLAKLNPYLLFGCSMLFYFVGRSLAAHAPNVPGSVFWGPCGPVTHAPLFVGGLLFARWLPSLSSSLTQRKRVGWLVVASALILGAAHFVKNGVVSNTSAEPLFIVFAAAIGTVEILWLDLLAQKFPSKLISTIQKLGKNSIQTLAAGLVLFNLFNLTKLHALTGWASTVIALSTFGIAVILLTQPVHFRDVVTLTRAVRTFGTRLVAVPRERIAIERLLASPTVWN